MMELKVLFIAVFLVGACAGFSLPEGREADEAEELEDMSDVEAETDLEDPWKVRRPLCQKRCFFVKYCYRRVRICKCLRPRRYRDESELDNQVNDDAIETEVFDEAEQQLEDPRKIRRRSCPRRLVRRLFHVKYGKRRLLIWACVPRCRFGDETGNDEYINNPPSVDISENGTGGR